MILLYSKILICSARKGLMHAQIQMTFFINTRKCPVENGYNFCRIRAKYKNRKFIFKSRYLPLMIRYT